MKQALKTAIHAEDLTVRQKLVLTLLSRSNEPSSPSEIRDDLVEVGVPKSSLKNISQTLSQSKDFIRTPSGWELSPAVFDTVKINYPALNKSESKEAVAAEAAVHSSPQDRPVVFFGHGRSGDWRVLKDYVVNQLGCDYEEYNREPTAGKSRKERLASMLNRAQFALLVMTAEDQMEDGSWRARENVVHEVGLFQGRLEFERAIVVLQNGCNEFSNIAGLDQIRYESDIMSIAHQVRDVLVREDLIRM